jgi:hypothetical protein
MAVRGRDLNHHQYRFYGRKGIFLGKAPCRSSIKKLLPEQVMARAEICCSEYWRKCILVDGKDHILDTITCERAWVGMQRAIHNQITITPKKIPPLRGAIC